MIYILQTPLVYNFTEFGNDLSFVSIKDLTFDLS